MKRKDLEVVRFTIESLQEIVEDTDDILLTEKLSGVFDTLIAYCEKEYEHKPIVCKKCGFSVENHYIGYCYSCIDELIDKYESSYSISK